MSRFDLKLINGKTVQEILYSASDKIYEKVKNAYLLHENNQTHNPGSYFLGSLNNPGSRIIALPAYVGSTPDCMGIKWIGSNPKNIKSGFPRASALIILNDTDTMMPLCCMEGSIISATRTSVSAVLATEVLNNGVREAESLGIIGNGFIPETIVNYFHQYGWKFDNIFLYDLDKKRSEQFSGKNDYYSYEILASHEELIRKSDITLFTTTVPKPYFDDVLLLGHNPLLLNISLRDIGTEVILSSQNIVDDIDHVLNANTSVHLAQQKIGNATFIDGTLANVMTSDVELRNNKPKIFSPMGLGVLDIALAELVYQEAVEIGNYINIEDFTLTGQ